MAWLKYIVVLIALFSLGAVMLGTLNPGIKVEGETNLYTSVGGAWDAYLDTTKWQNWKVLDGEYKWKEGKRFEEGAAWEISNPEGQVCIERIQIWKADSLLETQVECSTHSIIRKTLFSIDNGKAQIKEEERWSTEGLMENINLHFDATSKEKMLEIRMDSFQNTFSRKPSELQR